MGMKGLTHRTASFAGLLILASGTPAFSGETARTGITGAPPPLPVYRPDAMVRIGTRGAFTGNDIYKRANPAQKVFGKTFRGKTLTYAVRFQNDGDTIDRFTLKTSGNAPAGYSVTYRKAGKNITSAVNSGKYSTGNIAPGKSQTLIVKVAIRQAAKKGSKITRALTIFSENSPSTKDTVTLVTNLHRR